MSSLGKVCTSNPSLPHLDSSTQYCALPITKDHALNANHQRHKITAKGVFDSVRRKEYLETVRQALKHERSRLKCHRQPVALKRALHSAVLAWANVAAEKQARHITSNECIARIDIENRCSLVLLHANSSRKHNGCLRLASCAGTHCPPRRKDTVRFLYPLKHLPKKLGRKGAATIRNVSKRYNSALPR
jgi:hypothetical protein